MREEEFEPFADLLSDVMAYYRQDLSKFSLGVFWEALKQFAWDDVSRAFSAHARDAERGQFAPRVADLTRLLEGTGGEHALQAWTHVRTAIKSVGPYRSVAFYDPLIHLVIEDMGGWSVLCDMKTEEAPFRAKDFADRFRAYALRRCTPIYPPMLLGEFDAANRRSHPDAVLPPVLIGDVQRCKAVIAGGGERAAMVTDMRVHPAAVTQVAA